MIQPTRELVSLRVRESWDTLRRVPAPSLRHLLAFWPDVVRDAIEAYGYDAPLVRLSPAHPRAIDRMDETFLWFSFLRDQRHLTAALWMCCGRGMGTFRAGAILGVHRNTVRNRRDDALDLIVDGLRRDLADVQIVRHCAVRTLTSAHLRTVSLVRGV